MTTVFIPTTDGEGILTDSNDIQALVDEGLLVEVPQPDGTIAYSITQKGYQAVDSNFGGDET